jgi:hypothetical protein
MIDPSDKKLSIRKQAKLLVINRNRLTTCQTRTTEEDRKIMTIMDKIYMEYPWSAPESWSTSYESWSWFFGLLVSNEGGFLA